MPSNPNLRRPLYTPPADFNHRTIPSTRQPHRNWFRVHRSGVKAIQFGTLPHHRFSHSDSTFPWFYAGSSVSVCLWEYFGDDVFGGRHVISARKWEGCSLSRIRIPQVKACAVSLESTRNFMGVDKASLLASDLSVPQAWGLAVQQHPARFEAIKYSSRFIDQPCLALFDRGGMAARLQETWLGELKSLNEAADWLDEHEVALV
jgi:hypothetical protein